MNLEYFDIHSHLNFEDYDSDLTDVVRRLNDTKTGTIVVGTDLESSGKAVELASLHENVWACIGVHPIGETPSSNGAGPVHFDQASFDKLAKNKKVVAVGECGMDFFHADKGEDYERQKKLFLDQIGFALEHDLPIMIHSRPARLPGGGDAYLDLLEILEPLKKIHGEKLRGNVHFFAGDIDIAKRFIDINFTLSFTGVITFTHDYDEVIKFAPLSMIMSETDAPFVAPVPYRGKRNEPSYVQEVAGKIAEIRDEDPETVKKALIDNVFRVFRL